MCCPVAPGSGWHTCETNSADGDHLPGWLRRPETTPDLTHADDAELLGAEPLGPRLRSEEFVFVDAHVMTAGFDDFHFAGPRAARVECAVDQVGRIRMQQRFVIERPTTRAAEVGFETSAEQRHAGRAAFGPMLPRPNTAVPSVTIATVFFRIV